jgi:hypothetical protein
LQPDVQRQKGNRTVSEPKHPEQINRDYIRLLQVMRRFVREEFSVAIRMTQEDAVPQLLHYAAESRNHVLQEMGKELREMTQGSPDPAERPDARDGEQVRYYRGVAIGGARPVAKAVNAEVKSRPTRVYRGQVISDP